MLGRIVWVGMGVSCLCIAFLAFCTPGIEELSRHQSPGLRYEAVIAERLTDATVVTPMEIYVVRTGRAIGGTPVFRASRVGPLVVHWMGDERLIIEADGGQVYVQMHEVRLGGRTILIQYK